MLEVRKDGKESLKELDDEMLIERYRKHKDNLAMEMLIKRYQSVCSIKARSFFLNGGDIEDLIQEGMIGVYEALQSFNMDYNVSFKTFANLLIDRKLLNIVEKSNRKKHSPLNNYLSLSEGGSDEDISMDSIRASANFKVEPSNILIDNESLLEYSKEIELKLSGLEMKILNEYLSGLSYNDIGSKLGIDTKSVDNAIQRLRKKLKK